MTPPLGSARAGVISQVDAIPDSGNLQNNWIASSFALNDGDSITSAWQDEQGNADAEVVGSPTYKSNAINGEAAIAFDGSNDAFDTLIEEDTSEPHSYYIVSLVDTEPSYLWGASDADDIFFACKQDPNTWYGSYSGFDNPEGFVTGEYLIHGITAGSGSAEWYANQTQEWSVSYSGGQLVGQTSAIGARHRGDGSFEEPINGRIAEILRYSADHNSTTRQEVENYLNDKYAVF